MIETERDIKSAIDFLTQSELLKIEDILPFFPEFQRIDDFKQGTHGTEGTEGYSAYCMHWRVGLRDLRVRMGTRGTEGSDWYPGALRVLRVLIGTQGTNWYPGVPRGTEGTYRYPGVLRVLRVPGPEGWWAEICDSLEEYNRHISDLKNSKPPKALLSQSPRPSKP